MQDLIRQFQALLERQEGQIGRLSRLNDAHESLITQGLNLMAVLDDKVAAMAALVDKETTAEASLETLTAQLGQLYKDAVANAGGSPAVLAAIDAVSAKVSTNIDTITASTLANTPAAAPAAPGP